MGDNDEFIPKAGYTQFPNAYHVIPDDGYDHVQVANTCPCIPSIKGDVITHNPLRYRRFTEEEKAAIRCGDQYDPEDSDVSDSIIERGRLINGH
jgi:predicted GTPase